jgi:hypothetical protein
MNIDLSNTYWEEIIGFISEHDIDKRWLLRKENEVRTYGSLRIVSHPDLKPGYLRSILTYVTDINPKTKKEIYKAIDDYMMDVKELELYSVSEDIKTEQETVEAPYKKLEEIFGVKIFK